MMRPPGDGKCGSTAWVTRTVPNTLASSIARTYAASMAPKGTIRRDAGAVDQDIDAAETSDGVGGDPLCRIGIGDVALHGQALSTGCCDFRGEIFGCIAARLVADRHMDAGCGEAARNPGADSARTAGNQRDLAAQ